MYEPINENISVVGVYKNSKFIPRKFKWKDRVFPIKEITLSNAVRDGIIKKYLYSVVVGPNLYRIEFNRETESWKLLEVWAD